MRALRMYRQARGFCDRCGVKWSREHKCAAIVQLQVMEEVLDLFHPTESVAVPEEVTESADQLLWAISSEAVTGVAGPWTLQFYGEFYGNPVLILVDSGSTTFFLTQHIAGHCTQLLFESAGQFVRVDNDSLMRCSCIAEKCT